jgi:nucleoside-diphosphate-sugar epimerase
MTTKDRGMRVLVAGGAGYIGRVVTAALLQAGREVTVPRRAVSADRPTARQEAGDRRCRCTPAWVIAVGMLVVLALAGGLEYWWLRSRRRA